jgi:ribose 5-phosphate isomerase RpiB
MRVKQISLDILVGSDVDGEELAEDIMNELESRGFRVLGAGFQYDMTEEYQEHFPKMLEEE